MSLWWLEPGWGQTRCGRCQRQIWPEGDPDWGLCFSCFSDHIDELRGQVPQEQEPQEEPRQEDTTPEVT